MQTKEITTDEGERGKTREEEFETSSSTTTITKREERGERRRRRHEATLARHAINQSTIQRLQKPPETCDEFASRWDSVYTSKTPYKDRHLLRSFLSDIVSPSVSLNPKTHIPPLHQQQHQQVENKIYILEVGCGIGNSIFPLLRANPLLFGIGFDISKQAILSIHENAEFQNCRLNAFVADASIPDTYVSKVANICEQGVDFVTLVWTLSAMCLKRREDCVKGIVQCVKTGGVIHIRDFAVGDMRYLKFKARREEDNDVKEENLFLRGDGTYAYFFSVDELKELFENVGGMICESCEYEQRCVTNRKEHLTMHRRWVVGKFRKP